MTTFKLYTVYAFYTVKIYKNNPPKIVKGGGGAGPGSAFPSHNLHS